MSWCHRPADRSLQNHSNSKYLTTVGIREPHEAENIPAVSLYQVVFLTLKPYEQQKKLFPLLHHDQCHHSWVGHPTDHKRKYFLKKILEETTICLDQCINRSYHIKRISKVMLAFTENLIKSIKNVYSCRVL
jgi:hypothetical protein